MTGSNMFNQTPTTASPFTAPAMNTTPAFAAPQAQQSAFGNPVAANPQQAFSFGSGLQSDTAAQQQSKNVFARLGAFGGPPATAAPAFGSPAPAPAGFTFPGAATSQTSAFNPVPAPSQTSLFGAATATSQASPFAPAAATPQTGSSLFNPTSAAPQPSSLFNPTAATPQTGSSLFNPTAATPQASSLFNPTSAAPQTSSLFAPTPATSQTSAFAAPSATPLGLSFGAPAAAQTGGVTFGSGSALTQVSFGAPQTSTAATPQIGSAFGAPSATPQLGLASGDPAAAQTGGATFGSGSALSQVSFGVPQATTAATPQTNPLFATPSAISQPVSSSGDPAAAAQTGPTFGSGSCLSQVSFGAPQATTAATPLSGLASTAPTSATSTLFQTGLSSGVQSAPAPTFGIPASTATQPGTAAPAATTVQIGQTLGAVTTTAPAATTAPGVTFGIPASTAQPTLSFGTGSVLGSTTTTSASPFPSLLTSTTAPATSSAFTSLGSTSTTPATCASSLFANLTSTATTSAAAAPAGVFSIPTPAVADSGATVSSATTSAGLGGVDHSAVTTTQSAANTITSVKEQPLPNEIQQTVLAFKEHVKLQKSLSSEVARISSEPLVKLTKQINVIENLITNLGSVLSQQKFTAEKMKLETIKALNDYELVQKIKDSPVASEERLRCIQKYFLEKISSFEESTKTLQEKIDYVFQHVSTLPQENSLSAEALKLIVKKLHDSFVAIGARTYKLHNDMQLLKVQYMTIRNQYVKDKSPIPFSLHREVELPAETRAQSSELSLEGPSPFSRTGNGSLNSMLLMSQNRSAVTSSSNSSVVGGILNTSRPLGLADATGTSSLFDQSSAAGTSQQFNLQKPPFGTKRGKR